MFKYSTQSDCILKCGTDDWWEFVITRDFAKRFEILLKQHKSENEMK